MRLSFIVTSSILRAAFDSASDHISQIL
jgi:hypothetical protein